MKLHSLWLGEYRVLRNISIDFSPKAPRDPGDEGDAASHALDLLVGVNGTGKSTVLRALVEVLRTIEGNSSAADLLFRITYERPPGELITIANVDAEGRKVIGKFGVRKDGGEEELQSDVSPYAPALYVSYTTGRQTGRARTEPDVDPRLLKEGTGNAYWLREQPDGDPPPSAAAGESASSTGQRHFEITADDLPLVTLCGVMQAVARNEPEPIVRDALRELDIEQLSAFTLRFRVDPGVGGPRLNETIERLRGVASRTRVHGSSLSFVFDLRGREAAVLEGVSAAFGAESPVGLFRQLAANSRPQAGFRPVLPRVELFFERRPPRAEGQPVPHLHTYDWLSDGERTFLARICLLSLFGSADALILLDEPEVHFNDYWKRRLVRMVDRALARHHSHAIITTHSSIVLTDARRSQITVLSRSDDGHTREARPPGVPTFAGDPSDVLIQVFGAEAAAGAKSVDEVGDVLARYEHGLRSGMDLDRLNALHGRLERLQEELAPGYWRFRVADALARSPKIHAP